jgi:hypothetical protein
MSVARRRLWLSLQIEPRSPSPAGTSTSHPFAHPDGEHDVVFDRRRSA